MAVLFACLRPSSKNTPYTIYQIILHILCYFPVIIPDISGIFKHIFAKYNRDT